jgi:hypothetical protein
MSWDQQGHELKTFLLVPHFDHIVLLLILLLGGSSFRVVLIHGLQDTRTRATSNVDGAQLAASGRVCIHLLALVRCLL